MKKKIASTRIYNALTIFIFKCVPIVLLLSTLIYYLSCVTFLENDNFVSIIYVLLQDFIYLLFLVLFYIMSKKTLFCFYYRLPLLFSIVHKIGSIILINTSIMNGVDAGNYILGGLLFSILSIVISFIVYIKAKKHEK